MSTNIRLMRMGKKKSPYYRIVVAHSRNARDGAYIESVGFYRPMEQKDQISVNLSAFDAWVQKGAQVSSTVKQLVCKVRSL